MRQAEILEGHVEVHRVIHLTCPNRNELGRRMRKRALKEGRYDDASDEVISQRIQTYEEETKPLIQFYDGKVVDIDATKQPIEVLGDIVAELVRMAAYKAMAKLTV